jgi:hypothetical protein
VAADYKPVRAVGSQRRPGLESRTLDKMFDPSVVMKSFKQPDDGWGALREPGAGHRTLAVAVRTQIDVSMRRRCTTRQDTGEVCGSCILLIAWATLMLQHYEQSLILSHVRCPSANSVLRPTLL